MSLKRFQAWDGHSMPSQARVARPGGLRHDFGHTHFWERAVSRRRFVGTAAGATGLVLSSGLWLPSLVHAQAGAAPKPIPGSDPELPAPLHFFLPGLGKEPSTITDFDGMIGIAEVMGTGKGTDSRTGTTTDLLFDVDVRFMKGIYVGTDGQRRNGTFGFI
ncbi:MAG TPA: hypothetical protein VEQ11_09045 [Chloroflexota bacterium]|nr:hypothetical protein [Chloroflexota bacterium]